MFIISVCKKTHSVSKKRQDQGARRPKKHSVQSVLEHFLDKRNADIDVFLETLITGMEAGHSIRLETLPSNETE